MYCPIKKWKESTGEWRALHNEGIHNLYSSRDIIISSKRRRWAGHVTRMREIRNAHKILLENLKQSDRGGGLNTHKGLLLQQTLKSSTFGLCYLRPSVGLFCTMYRALKFHKKTWNFFSSEQLSVFLEEYQFMKVVNINVLCVLFFSLLLDTT